MAEMKFEIPVFIKEKHDEPIDLVETPYFYNDGGCPSYVKNLPHGAKLIQTALTDTRVALGNEYVVSQIKGIKNTPPYGIETQLGFIADRVAYAPMWATPDVAAAFGITLVETGQAVQLESPVHKLSQIEYEYGVFAGHWSPYQETGNKLLSVVCTDLEHHDFPHIFASIDRNLPLVTSVGRYWPKLSKICLADLWVPRGSALYIPPKPVQPDSECIDLHNNRNSARACWGNVRQNTVLTKTLLQEKNGFFYWYWNATQTVHTQPLMKG